MKLTEQTRSILDVVLPGMLTHYQNKVSVTSDVLDDIATAIAVLPGHRPDTAIRCSIELSAAA